MRVSDARARAMDAHRRRRRRETVDVITFDSRVRSFASGIVRVASRGRWDWVAHLSSVTAAFTQGVQKRETDDFIIYFVFVP